MIIIHRTSRRIASKKVCKLSKELQVKKKRLDYDTDSEDGDILTDRITHIYGDQCNLKQMKR
ncbi:hypothetical protein HPB47_001882 [Ixodes persulcatus]|uniref:Uncharacterized protein n=1 Tax=Ixodes persulcatus TaxID=34615 RepID=A0AC60PP86_IXOPE|nr:hypothetical protein HPB47_001882 [Ixodes persulcatus]